MQRTVVVTGAGISGLAACCHLAKYAHGTKVILLEASDRLGGWLHSTRTERGAVFEHGPRGIRPAGPVGKNTLKLVSDLGLENDILPVPGDHPASQNRYLYVDGKIHKLPSSIGSILQTSPPFTKPIIGSILKELMVRREKTPDETVHAFMQRRFGKELADIAVDSLCRGVFAGDCRKLSVRSCFPMLYNAEQKYGSVVLGMLFGGEKGPRTDVPLSRRAVSENWSQWSFKTGIQTLPESMEDFLKGRGVEIHRNAPVQKLERTGDDSWEVKLQDGTIKADHVISATSAKALSFMLPPSMDALTEELRQILSATVAVVNLEYEGSVLPFVGFGHLVPSLEDACVLGIIYDSVSYPQQNRTGAPTTRLTVMMGGAWFLEQIGDPDKISQDHLLKVAMEAVRCHLGVQTDPLYSITHIQKECIPQYTVGHWKRLENITNYLHHSKVPLSVVGASYQGVSVNDCIYFAQLAVDKLLGKSGT
ncbi:protoporphyrinogen oxidase [Latimeria chalumnae]|uniref:protoporphyrinogen oxidase n=1 Tax=Latimeria chalumnae TaxID=7897 RepID=UPI00313BCD0D